MTSYSKSSLKTYFETNDIPTGTDYANLIDSCLNLVETTQQAMAGPLYSTEVITPKVSATSITSTNITVTSTVSADTATVATVNASSATVTGAVSAATFYGKYLGTAPVIVSATGTTQATGASITAYITRGQGSTDGSATGYVLPSPTVGWTQYFIHEGAVSANLWPSTDCTINALATNAAYGIAANTLYTIVHKTSKGFAVK